ncbi:MAG: ABC transporter permease subunit [Bifidobacteriales bacterium]|nr:ABC transporter permease subunit [Bifidobacteriales bacterium]
MSADSGRRVRRSRREIPAGPDKATPRHGSAFTRLRRTSGLSFLDSRRPSGQLTLFGAVRGELRKMLSLRSTWVLLLIVMLLQPLSTGLMACATRVLAGLGWQTNHLLAHLLPASSDVFWSAVVSGLFPGMIVAGILGVLVLTREFSGANIESTLTANPRRGMVLMAKGLALALSTWLAAQVGLLFSWILAALLLPGRSGTLPVYKPGLDLLGGPLILVLFALMGLGLGALSRSRAGGVGLFLGLTLILPLILGLLGGLVPHVGWLQAPFRLTPTSLLVTFLSGLNRAAETGIGWWQAGLILMVWTALCCALGTLVFRRADIG